MGTALVVLVLLALCGFIAYIGDLLGRRLGKKRLSIFGLRPKHTAILLTVVTGVLIAGVTFGAALVAVGGFRNVVLEGERLAGRNQQLENQNTLLEKQNRRQTADNTALQEKSKELQSANESLAGDNKELAALNSSLAGQKTTLQRQNTGLQTHNAELRSKNSELQAASKDLQAKNGRLQADATRLQGEAVRLKSQAVRLQGEQKRLSTEAGRLRQETSQLKAGNYRFVIGQPLSAGRAVMIPPNPPREVLASSVSRVKYEADTAAGAAVQVVPPAGFSSTAGGPALEHAIQDWVVRQAQQIRNRPVVIRMVAAENCVEGRPVCGRYVWFANDRVFAKDEVIARRVVDGGASRGQVLQDVLTLLRQDVRAKAMSREMLAGAEGELGEKTWDEVLDTCDAIRGGKRRVTLVALARQDTYRAGPLNVDLRLNTLDVSQGFK